MQRKLMPYVAGYGPGSCLARLTPGPVHWPGAYINIKWLATGLAYGLAPALRS